MLWYSLEVLQWGASNEYPQHMSSWRNKKNINTFGLKKKKKGALISAMMCVNFVLLQRDLYFFSYFSQYIVSDSSYEMSQNDTAWNVKSSFLKKKLKKYFRVFSADIFMQQVMQCIKDYMIITSCM